MPSRQQGFEASRVERLEKPLSSVAQGSASLRPARPAHLAVGGESEEECEWERERETGGVREVVPP